MATHKPLIGPPSPYDRIGLCTYKPTPDAVACLAPALWHGLVLNPVRTTLMTVLSSCDDHRGYMARTADFIHPFDTACGIDGAWWNHVTGESGCEIDWNIGDLAQTETASAA
jgi:hypothetical protein